MRILILLISLVLSTNALAQDIPVQLIHNRGRHPRPVFRLAKEPFRDIGINLKLRKTIRTRLGKSYLPPGTLMFIEFAKYQKKMKDGWVTIVMPKSQWPKQFRGGVAYICDGFGVATWNNKIGSSAHILAHEIGHTLGAKHEPGDSLMSPYINRAMWLDDKAALEISWCLDKGGYENIHN
jgi:hypothetical protein